MAGGKTIATVDERGRVTVPIPDKYVKNERLTPHAGAYAKGVLAKLRAQDRTSPYDIRARGAAGFAAAWFDGFDSGVVERK